MDDHESELMAERKRNHEQKLLRLMSVQELGRRNVWFGKFANDSFVRV